MRMVNRIHVVEEARHVRFAREEVARLMAGIGPVRGFLDATSSAIVAAIIVSSLINPAVYEAVGLDRNEAIASGPQEPALPPDPPDAWREDHGLPDRAGHDHLVRHGRSTDWCT